MAAISIIVPVYNAEQTIERCIESVLAQTFCDWELILIDDGTPDNSGAICDAYAAASGNIRVIHQDNQGVSVARNVGIEASQSKYLLFLDSDDYLEETMLQVYFDHAKRYSSDVIMGGMRVIGNEKGTSKNLPITGEYDTSVFETICQEPEMFGYVGGKMIRASIVKQHKIRFRTDMQSQEDLEFFLSLYGFCRRFLLLEYAGYRYDFAPGKRFPPVWDFIANQMKLKSVAEQVAVISPKAKKAIEERVVRLLFSCLHSAVEHNMYDEAWDHLMDVSGLRTYMYSTQDKGEMYRIARWFAAERYYRIYRYLKWRIRLRKLIGRG